MDDKQKWWLLRLGRKTWAAIPPSRLNNVETKYFSSYEDAARYALEHNTESKQRNE